MGRKSTISRTLNHLSKEGWVSDIVEHWVPYTFRKRDLFEVIDILAVRPGEILGVQTTTGSNVSGHVAKCKAAANLPAWLEAGGKFQIWGWRKLKGRWKVRILHFLRLPSGKILVRENPMLLEVKELPEEIREYGDLGSARIYKATKKNSTTIIIRTVRRLKEVWYKVGKGWVKN